MFISLFSRVFTAGQSEKSLKKYANFNIKEWKTRNSDLPHVALQRVLFHSFAFREYMDIDANINLHIFNNNNPPPPSLYFVRYFFEQRVLAANNLTRAKAGAVFGG